MNQSPDDTKHPPKKAAAATALLLVLLIASLTYFVIGNTYSKYTNKTAKINTIRILHAADAYFKDHPVEKGTMNTVTIGSLTNGGYIENLQIDDNTFWVTDTKPSQVCGRLYDTRKNKTIIEYKAATVQMIQNSGFTNTIGDGVCSMPDAEMTP